MRMKKKFAYTVESGIHWNFYREEYKNKNIYKASHKKLKTDLTVLYNCSSI